MTIDCINNDNISYLQKYRDKVSNSSSISVMKDINEAKLR